MGWRRVTGATAAIVFGFMLVGCAPEDSPAPTPTVLRPGSIGGIDSPAPSAPKGDPKEEVDEEGVPAKTPPARFEGDTEDIELDTSGRVPIDTPKKTSLPASFPTSDVQIPQRAEIFDSGERGSGWFVVLRGSSLGDVSAMFNEIVEASSLEVTQSEVDRDGGLTATASSASVHLEALSQQIGDDVLISLEIQPAH